MSFQNETKMNTSQLESVFKSNPGFLGVFPSNLIPKSSLTQSKKIGLIANLDPVSKPGSHWIAMFITPRENSRRPTLEYFDSYGRALPNKFSSLRKDFNLVHNKLRLQSFYTTNCGQFCVYFLKKRFAGKTFLSILKTLQASSDPDKKVKRFVLKKFPDLNKHRGCEKNHRIQCCRPLCPAPPCRSR